MTSGLKDNLVAVMTVLEDLCDLEATVITTYVTALKVSSNPDTLALIEAETTASKEVTLKHQLNSCLKKSPSNVRKHVKLRFNLQEFEE